MNDLFLIIIPSFVTAVTTWAFSRKKYRAETKANELDNVDKAAKIWRELSEDLEKRLKEDIRDLRNENTAIQKQFVSVLAENNALKEQMTALQKQLKEARCENQKLLDELRKFNKNYSPAS